MSLGKVAIISIEGEWMSFWTGSLALKWNIEQPVTYAFKGMIQKSDTVLVNGPDRLATDEFYGGYILQ